VPKPLKTAGELIALLNAELRKHDACAGVSVDAITPVPNDTVDYTWTASVVRAGGAMCIPSHSRRARPPPSQLWPL
jgi:hypothetical protein